MTRYIQFMSNLQDALSETLATVLILIVLGMILCILFKVGQAFWRSL